MPQSALSLLASAPAPKFAINIASSSLPSASTKSSMGMEFPRLAPKLSPAGEHGGDGYRTGGEGGSGPPALKRIPYACTSCKKAKTKCSGMPAPCTRCQRFNNGDSCVFDEATDQRRRVAAKRTAEELRHHQAFLNQLIQAIGQATDDELFNIRNLAQRGASIDDLKIFAQGKLNAADSAISSSPNSVSGYLTAHSREVDMDIDEMVRTPSLHTQGSSNPSLQSQSSTEEDSTSSSRRPTMASLQRNSSSISSTTTRSSDILQISNILSKPDE